MQNKYGIYLLKTGSEYVYFDSKTLSIFTSNNLDDNYFDQIKDNRIIRNKEPKEDNKNKERLYSLTLCAATGCNLRCKYCYAEEGSYNKSFRVMKLEEMKSIFSHFCKIYPLGIGNITFFGGEPLLSRNSIIKFVYYVEDYCKNNKIQMPTFSIVTNGTLINKEIIDLFNKYHFLVTLSIDGVKEINDYNRIYKNKTKSVYNDVKNIINQIKKRSFLLACESTLTPYFFSKYETKDLEYYLSYIKDLKVDFAIPFVAEGDQYDYSDKNILRKVRLFYSDLLDYYFSKWLSKEYKLVPPSIASRVCQIVKKSSPKTCIAGKKMLFVDSNYDVYPCQMFYNKNCRKMFNLMKTENLEIRNIINNFSFPNRENIKECKKCIANKCCTSWCTGASINYNNTETSIVPIRCFVEKVILEKCILFIAKCKKENEKLFVDVLKKLSTYYSFDKGNYVYDR